MEITKAGIFSVVGRPNAGKSTLLNALCKSKVAIVSSKPQTTRTRITGVANVDDCQLVFIDTPGLHKPKTRLGEYMVKIIGNTVASVDVAVLLVEPVARIGVPEQMLIDRLKELDVPAVLVINKLDTVRREALLEVVEIYRTAYEFDAILPVSAKTGEGVDTLARELCGMCVPSEQLFPDGMISDQPERQIVAEIIREKLLERLDKEIPHGIAVEIEKFEERENGVVDVGAVIFCERKSHKGIIIGKNGAMLKSVGTAAREELESIYEGRVFLQLWVKVKEGWRDSPGQLKNFGYENE